jgi:hypothetical protein
MKEMHRPISEIAKEIKKDWKKVYYGAVPYLEAMCSLDQVTDSCGQDSTKSVIVYFLGNAQSYRGETARKSKAELKEIIK